MRLPVLLVALLLSSGVVAEHQACAAVIQVSASGTVDNGFDGAGLFGAPASDLVGRPYTLIFSIDTSQGFVTGGNLYRTYTSVLHSPNAHPAITGQITVNEVSYLVDGSRGGVNQYLADDHTSQNSLFQDVLSRDAELSLYDGVNPISPNAPGADYPAVFHDPNFDPMGFTIDLGDFIATLGRFAFAHSGVSTYLDLRLQTVTYEVLQAGGGPTSFVPEPGIWALMLSGFGAVGVTLRTRKPAKRHLRRIGQTTRCAASSFSLPGSQALKSAFNYR